VPASLGRSRRGGLVSVRDDKPSEHPRRPASQRQGSLATRIALGTLLLVVCASSLVLVELTRFEWQRLVQSKHTAADMVAKLFASSVAAALDFADKDALQTALDGLRSNTQIVYAAVYPPDRAAPLAEYRPRVGAARAVLRPEEAIEVTDTVRSPTGGTLGSVLIRVSLEQEELIFRHTRARLVGFGAFFAVALATLLVGVARKILVLPLSRLQAAAVQLAVGERVQVPIERNDEIGRLSRTFNAMAASIEERGQRIASQNDRLQALLDNMGQAILVFGEDGLLTRERSRSAERWLGAHAGRSVLDTLYPADEDLGIERQAFEAWIEVVFSSAPERFQELLTLAPQTLTRHIGAEQLHFELMFRLPEQATGPRQIMLLATDVSERRRLEQAVAKKDREHELQISALRRLATGGGQLFVGFLENTRRRLGNCHELMNLRVGLELVPKALDRLSTEAMFQQLHTVRAEARCFDLAELESKLSVLEAQLVTLREAGYRVTPREQEDIARGVDELGHLLDEAERLFVEQSPLGAVALDQISVRRSRLLALAQAAHAGSKHTARLIEELTARPLVESFALLPEAALRWAEYAGKRVRLELEHGDTEIPFALSRVLGGVLSHLVRNAIAHGIEPEAERLSMGKPAAGKVRLSAEQTPGGPSISVSDDGRGFSPELMKTSDREPGAELNAILGGALRSGFSSNGSPDELSGGGVGLAAAQNELGLVGYHIYLTETSGRGSSFKLLPVAGSGGEAHGG
jgi:two-component system chemotaxis sensor kinase CheA